MVSKQCKARVRAENAASYLLFAVQGIRRRRAHKRKDWRPVDGNDSTLLGILRTDGQNHVTRRRAQGEE
jgi:hypothetical protein